MDGLRLKKDALVSSPPVATTASYGVMRVERVGLAHQNMLEGGLGCVTPHKKSNSLKLQVDTGPA